MPLKQTVLHDTHVRAGAKIVPFAGFEMPVQYRGIMEEHRSVRNGVGVFDVSHMGEFEIRGKDALAFVQKVTTNDASKMSVGRVQYSAMCNEQGGIIDDLLVYCMGDAFILVVNAANIRSDFEWLQSQCEGSVELKDVSDDLALLAVQGPKSDAVLRRLTETDISSIPYYHFVRGKVAGTEMMISRTGYTGELGYELYFPAQKQIAETTWNALMKAGEEFSIAPVGLGARDTLRLEMGFCLYGNDIDASTSPLEAGLGWITKLGKGDFVGRAALQKQKEQGLSRKLVGFVVGDRAFPRKGYEIRTKGCRTGMVTSGAFSPVLGQGIGMGYVGVADAEIGHTLDIMIREKSVPATIVDIPFVRKESR
jgi:aminomethyltransferase